VITDRGDASFWLPLTQDRDGEVVADFGGARKYFWLPPGRAPVSLDPPWMLGFAGHRWVIRFADGRRVVTNNLMGSGPIPAQFHHLFPVNAVLEDATGPFVVVTGSGDPVPDCPVYDDWDGAVKAADLANRRAALAGRLPRYQIAPAPRAAAGLSPSAGLGPGGQK
jgi:hypothetical protein